MGYCLDICWDRLQLTTWNGQNISLRVCVLVDYDTCRNHAGKMQVRMAMKISWLFQYSVILEILKSY